MGYVHRLVCMTGALLLAMGVSDAGLFGADKAKGSHPPKKTAPKVKPSPTEPSLKPKNPKTRSKAKGPTVAKSNPTTPQPKWTAPKGVVRPTVYQFARFNERTREYWFDKHWWYRFVIYPWTAGLSVMGPVNYTTVVPPANLTVTPPVIKAGQGLPFSAAGTKLAGRLDGMDIVNHWLGGQQVNWRTGNATGGKGPASNSGAFVTAVCARLKVPLAEPTPENFLPGNQYDWLLTEGKDKGWVALGDIEAQLLANQGWVVIASWKNPAAVGDPSLAGQSAIVRPSDTPASDIAQRGPRILMAGVKNYDNIALKDAFPAQAVKDVLYLAYRPR
jgi:hypothetical protein